MRICSIYCHDSTKCPASSPIIFFFPPLIWYHSGYDCLPNFALNLSDPCLSLSLKGLVSVCSSRWPTSLSLLAFINGLPNRIYNISLLSFGFKLLFHLCPVSLLSFHRKPSWILINILYHHILKQESSLSLLQYPFPPKHFIGNIICSFNVLLTASNGQF